jgi:hypothetical protein
LGGAHDGRHPPRHRQRAGIGEQFRRADPPETGGEGRRERADLVSAVGALAFLSRPPCRSVRDRRSRVELLSFLLFDEDNVDRRDPRRPSS